MANAIYSEMDDYGYDPTEPMLTEFTPLPKAEAALPASAMVNTQYLPPVGAQGACPSCVAWGSIYGMVTFMAASNGGYSPLATSQQASPGFIYMQVMQSSSEPADTCTGSKLGQYKQFLAGGTASLANAPYGPVGNSTECDWLWTNYGSGGNPPPLDSAFTVTSWSSVNTKNTDHVKQVLASGFPIAYGTQLYTDFSKYDGSPNPYIGNGHIKNNPKTGKPAGHCMLIIGYDDNCNGSGTGAVLIRNSWGADWGIDGQVWMAYDTFTAIAQGNGYYNPLS